MKASTRETDGRTEIQTDREAESCRGIKVRLIMILINFKVSCMLNRLTIYYKL